MNMADVKSQDNSKSWFYTDTVKDHFFNPRNLVKKDDEINVKDYNGVGMVGSPACITGDTLIAVADGRISVPIKQLVKENKNVPVYCYDNEKITISMARNFRKTRKKVPVLKIILDDNSSFKATIDHSLMLRERDYTEVRDLKNEESVMPFNKVIRKGYFYIYLNNGKRIREHEMIFEHFNGGIDNFNINSPNIHHIDENKLNNNINNLKLISGGEHARLHSIKNKRYLKGIVRDIKGDKNPMRVWWNNASDEEKKLYKTNMSFATSGERNGRWKKVFNETILKETYKYFKLNDIKLTNEKWKEFAKKKGFPQCVDPRFESFNNFKEQVISYNHKIKSTEFAGYEDVYNLTVDNFHNYAIITNKNKSFSGIINKNCGDMMKIWIKVDENEVIKECKFQTFGCASAISSTSILTVMVIENGGMKIEDALKIKPHDIVARLNGLPTRKFHCSVLGDKALRAAINDYFRRTGQNDRIIIEGARIIDKVLKITDKDIEEAVLDGADTFEKVQHKTKIGIQDKTCIPEVEQLIRFYKEKYFG